MSEPDIIGYGSKAIGTHAIVGKSGSGRAKRRIAPVATHAYNETCVVIAEPRTPASAKPEGLDCLRWSAWLLVSGNKRRFSRGAERFIAGYAHLECGIVVRKAREGERAENDRGRTAGSLFSLLKSNSETEIVNEPERSPRYLKSDYFEMLFCEERMKKSRKLYRDNISSRQIFLTIQWDTITGLFALFSVLLSK
ncbi:hypothetical protein PUN28_015902 [Cardiocondyla obscurior]|uniref:Uncharacterized protein n=1 Tax=Cardiocondyla obscurior TaxID=286306 RepID=A0AAW2ESH6_9HYME